MYIYIYVYVIRTIDKCMYIMIISAKRQLQTQMYQKASTSNKNSIKNASTSKQIGSKQRQLQTKIVSKHRHSQKNTFKKSVSQSSK